MNKIITTTIAGLMAFGASSAMADEVPSLQDVIDSGVEIDVASGLGEISIDDVREGLASADHGIDQAVVDALSDLNDADLGNAVEALDTGAVSIEEITAVIEANGGEIPDEVPEEFKDIDLGPPPSESANGGN